MKEEVEEEGEGEGEGEGEVEVEKRRADSRPTRTPRISARAAQSSEARCLVGVGRRGEAAAAEGAGSQPP